MFDVSDLIIIEAISAFVVEYQTVGSTVRPKIYPAISGPPPIQILSDYCRHASYAQTQQDH